MTITDTNCLLLMAEVAAFSLTILKAISCGVEEILQELRKIKKS